MQRAVVMCSSVISSLTPHLMSTTYSSILTQMVANFSTLERLYQGSLHPLVKYLEKDMSLSGFEPPTFCIAGGHSSKELSRRDYTF
jgi:hypothetical protein